MLNQEAFIDRLHKVFNHYGLSASTFADDIKVQRSSISHLLSGRNKPSLEFVLKIVDTYKEVDLDWLLYGKNTFPKRKNTTTIDKAVSNTLFNQKETEGNELTNTDEDLIQEQKKTTPSKIERIVIFYKDGTFKEYSENN
ncbi:transcriptional regulator with XRE-family HTH domain [Wenyingzhuangia heitensis]|uniref:Transcriptional regulator with XRE-family HTH domain n=1 Tax=Wenyingzhuangia heitensis TaxID=1487859 RepID=A0ABX0UES9_9FLAO|nr:helix-turn-helix transcriptional regulator [Wenyingzhuangia heitensis]NIJ46385.1 transcriptional regulator with XRE-family HTH domain [Wenyingzhuangia heitensis]